MPNIKSAIKRVKVTESKSVKNAIKKSALKTSVKKCKDAIVKKDSSTAEVLKNTVKALDQAVSKNLIHKNTAARKKSKLTKALNAANATK